MGVTDPTCIQKQKPLTWIPMSLVATRHVKKKCPTISILTPKTAETMVFKKSTTWNF